MTSPRWTVPRWSTPSGIAVRCVLAGFAVAAAVPPWGWWPLAFVGIALWDRLLAGQPARARFVRSWLVAAAWLFPATLWMWDLTKPGYVIAQAAYATYFAFAALAVPPQLPGRWIALPGAVTLAELARWTFPFGGVPLATLAMGQAAAPLGQTARLGTDLLVSALVVVGGIVLSAAWERRWALACAIAAGLVVVTGLAGVAPRGHPTGELAFAVVQGGGPQRTRAADTDEREVFERHLAATEAVTTPVDLVLWPENVVSVEGDLRGSAEGRELSALARRLGTTLVVGATEGDGPEHFRNASMVVNPDGTFGDRYDKVRRVPFGEYVPMRGLIERLAGQGAGLPARDAVPGVEPATIDTPAGRFGVVISWEVFFSDRVRDGIAHGGDVLLNPTNGSSYWLTQVQTQQVASSRLRAIESGRWVLQAAPTGFSAVVDADGDLLARSGVSETRVLQGIAQLREGQTIATRFGRVPIVVLAVLALVVGQLTRRAVAAGQRSPRAPVPARSDF
ncbi:apolipoprotein N-acyltransferase [Rhabdothermincola sp.]|uniref:apolipoprotein N-acyltransferase n=1 Tax=Rhabdothermincola sp. TaxID=2820405 RepID=UPI002FE3778F